ncbi:MAG: sulfite exporter TauE/SafE family protein [Gammaproteobacteria bacterium]|nr:sulfite exporter TauE/SafE family protein [Gammaproteobacteria bacterium]
MYFDATFLTLFLPVLVAAILQSATGIGYGVIAGPIFLAVLNGSHAFQISIVHNLLIALMLLPVVYRDFNRTVLIYLVLGSCLGIPAGFLLQLFVGVTFLKLFSMVVISIIAGALVFNMLNSTKHSFEDGVKPTEQLFIGSLAGFMTGILAMPGPLASAWMSIRGGEKKAIRATVLSFFIFAYGSILILQVLFSGISQATQTLSLALAPVVIIGILTGNALSHHISEVVFRFILLAVLCSTAIVLLVSL